MGMAANYDYRVTMINGGFIQMHIKMTFFFPSVSMHHYKLVQQFVFPLTARFLSRHSTLTLGSLHSRALTRHALTRLAKCIELLSRHWRLGKLR